MPVSSQQTVATPARRRTRLLAAVAAGALVVLGLAVSRVPHALADPAGDAVYAAFVYALVVVVAPRARLTTAAAAAFAVCALVELAQLTGLPARIVDVVPAARYALGTTFAGVDLLAYAAGVALAALVRRVAAVPR
ncbi:MAG: DUF2809 domain-containing protein [Cellulomonas sp.]